MQRERVILKCTVYNKIRRERVKDEWVKYESGWNTKVSDHDKRSTLKLFGFIKRMNETWVRKQIYKEERMNWKEEKDQESYEWMEPRDRIKVNASMVL